jgi:hypothetical protein
MEAFAPATISCRNIVFMKIQIGEWLPGQTGTASLQQDIHILADVLRAIVHMGPGVTFVVPFSIDDASAFWAEKALPGCVPARGVCSWREINAEKTDLARRSLRSLRCTFSARRA